MTPRARAGSPARAASELPLRELLRLAGEAEVAYAQLHVVHATLFEERNVTVCGLGGELTVNEDRTEDRLCYARASAEYFLRTFWRAEQRLVSPGRRVRHGPNVSDRRGSQWGGSWPAKWHRGQGR